MGNINVNKIHLNAAYGSNTNLRQMKIRCPTAEVYGKGVIKDYELLFKGSQFSAFATIAPCKGEEVPVLLWKLTPFDEAVLDRYEGVGSGHYFKQNVPVEIDGKTVNVMAYIMHREQNYGMPTRSYYQIVAQGYRDCGFDMGKLSDALDKSITRFDEPEQTDDMDFDNDEPMMRL